MITTTEYQEMKVTSIPSMYICDVCHTQFCPGKDTFQIQEFHHIRQVGGFSSAFGDMSYIECDICTACLDRLLGKYIRVYDYDPETGGGYIPEVSQEECIDCDLFEPYKKEQGSEDCKQQKNCVKWLCHNGTCPLDTDL